MLHKYFRLAALELRRERVDLFFPIRTHTYVRTHSHILIIHIVVTLSCAIELNVKQRIAKKTSLLRTVQKDRIGIQMVAKMQYHKRQHSFKTHSIEGECDRRSDKENDIVFTILCCGK